MNYKREGGSVTRPPLFEGENFRHWKVCTQGFLGAIDENMWDYIEFWQEPPKKSIGEVTLLKPRKEQTTDEKIASDWNMKGLNSLYNALSTIELNRIMSCTTDKDDWDTLILAHEGTSRVEKTKRRMLTKQLEECKMEKNESFDEFFARLSENH